MHDTPALLGNATLTTGETGQDLYASERFVDSGKRVTSTLTWENGESGVGTL